MACRFCPNSDGNFISLHDSADFANGMPLSEVVSELCPLQQQQSAVPTTDIDVGPQQICLEACLPRLADCFLFCRQIRQAEDRWRTNRKEICLKIEFDATSSEDKEGEYETEFLVYEEDVRDDKSEALDDDEPSDGKRSCFVLPPKELIRTRLEYNNFDYIEFEGEKCCGCGAFLESRADFETHADKVHRNCVESGGEEWHCLMCKTGFESKSDLEKHEQRFQSKHIFYCKLCLEGFYEKDEFLTHQHEEDDECEEDLTYQVELVEPPPTDGHDVEVDYQATDSSVERKPHGQRFTAKLPDQSLISSVDDYDQYQIIHVDNAERCCGCGVYFESFEQLMDHARVQHQSEQDTASDNPFCEVCFERFKAPYALNAHRTHCRYVNELYFCKLCQITYARKFHLAKHFATMPGHTTRIGGFEDSAFAVTVHDRSHDNLGMSCCFLKCSQIFETEKQLLAHVDEAHAPRLQLNKTERTSEAHVCTICQRSFASQQLLLLHRNRAAKKKHICSFCAEAFIIPSKLREHELLVHSGETVPQHPCDACDKSFRTKHLLKAHRQTHDQERNFPCDQCSAVFRLRLQLRKHVRGVHPTCFPYECAYCEKKFSTKPKHDLHLRSHTGEKPYPCRYESCGKQFSHVTDRKRHEMGVHTSERPYQCEQCPAAYIRKRELLIHQQRHRVATRCVL